MLIARESAIKFGLTRALFSPFKTQNSKDNQTNLLQI